MPTRIEKYFSLIKFSHTVFAMPFAIIGFFLGVHSRQGQWTFTWMGGRLLWVVACMIFARSAAMAFNRYLDRSFDAENPRTASREIPTGKIHPARALLFTGISALLFVGTTWLINPICFALSPVALAVVLGYSYTKRFTAFCHLILGIGLSLAPIGAYLAVTGTFHFLPILFSLAVIGWVSGFDIIYALQDEDFDRKHRLHSIPAWLGKAQALLVSRLLHGFSFAIIIWAGIIGEFGWIYVAGTLIYGAMLLYQQWIVSPRDLSRVNIAFMTANGMASVLFAAFVITDILIRN